MENAYKGKKKFGAADLHVTEPTPVCYLFVSPRWMEPSGEQQTVKMLLRSEW